MLDNYRKKNEKVMNKTEMSMLHWIHIRNEEIGQAGTVQPITTHLVQKRLRWYGHVRRRYDQVLDMEVEGVRPRGRPTFKIQGHHQKIYKHNVKNMTASTGEWQYPGRPTDV